MLISSEVFVAQLFLTSWCFCWRIKHQILVQTAVKQRRQPIASHVHSQWAVPYLHMRNLLHCAISLIVWLFAQTVLEEPSKKVKDVGVHGTSHGQSGQQKENFAHKSCINLGECVEISKTYLFKSWSFLYDTSVTQHTPLASCQRVHITLANALMVGQLASIPFLTVFSNILYCV